MGWETRRNGRSYYYAYSREGGRRVKRYCGCGPIAAFEESTRAQIAALRRAEQMVLRVETGKWNDIEGTLNDVKERIAPLVNAALVAAGYHRPSRHAWRKKRKRNQETEQLMARTQTKTVAKTELQKAAEWTVPATFDERLEIVRAAQKKGEHATDQETVRALACLKKYPNEIAVHTGDCVEAVLYLGTRSPVSREIMRQETEAHRKLLAGPNPSPLESLCIERILSCRIAVAYYEKLNARIVDASRSGNITIDQVEAIQGRIERANRQYMAAIKMLATVRKMALPTLVQVNIAENGGQQVNIAGNVTPQTPLGVPAS